MKNKIGTTLTVLLVAASLMLTVSCQKKTVAVEDGSMSTAQEGGSAVTTADTSQTGEDTIDTAAASNERTSYVVLQEDIFFEFDKATLTEPAIEILTQNGKWLRINSDVSIVIEGHCDARGTNDYNLALGDRRAESVKNFLADLGIDRTRISTISYGEERPAVLGHNEAAWAKNRRAHFLIQ